ncbi:hypothetical protein [Butyrivibrio sp. FC2001]|uniref:hypothetical protein n=1 Tax=Butyrivibrio sp. FC2001 TaxID=1280671 RepID=UPI00040FF894|nr:hypothetical protein [Butyrivibrio sp. FC2001]
MKKNVNFGVVIAAVFITVFAVLLALFIYMLNTSNKLREFKVDMFVLCNEADLCVRDSDEGKIRIDSDNLIALNSIIYGTRGYFTLGTPKTSEEITLDFDHQDDKWNMTIARAGENRLMIDLEGPRKYKVYIKDNKKFEEIKKCVSKDGYHTANKLIGSKQ